MSKYRTRSLAHRHLNTSRPFAILVSLGDFLIRRILEDVAARERETCFLKTAIPQIFTTSTCLVRRRRTLLWDLLLSALPDSKTGGDVGLKYVSLTLVIVILAGIAFWNYLFFRVQSLHYSSLWVHFTRSLRSICSSD